MRISDWSSDVCSSDLIVLGLGLFVRDWWIVLLVVPALVAWWFDRKRRDPAFRARLDEWILGRKLAGSLVAKLDTARLMRTLGTLLKNGVPLLTAIGIGRHVLDRKRTSLSSRH